MNNFRTFLISDDYIMRNYLRNFITDLNLPVGSPVDQDSLPSVLEELKSFTAGVSLIVYDLRKVSSQTLQQIQELKKMGSSLHLILLVGQTHFSMVDDLIQSTLWKVVGKPFFPGELKKTIFEFIATRTDIVFSPVDVITQKSDGNNHGDGVGSNHKYLLGNSRQIEEVNAIIDRVASTDVTVLIRGESGTGKELVARAMYEGSHRSSKPFVTVLCPAIPEGLLESELFGYEKGSFTGAVRRRPGKFEIGNHGTIFLDEIGDIPFGLQSKLLHVLQGGGFSRNGGSDIRVDVRILAATNRDLEKAVAEGAFRQDLYYRLNVVGIALPPLRERMGDIPILVEWFLRKYNDQFNMKYQPLSNTTLDYFSNYTWPGNIRELENLIKRIVVMRDENVVLKQHRSEVRKRSGVFSFPAFIPGNVPNHPANQEATLSNNGFSPMTSLKEVAREAMRKAEGEAISKALEQTRWNRKAAARLLKISYKALLYKIRQCDLIDQSKHSDSIPRT